MSISIVSKIAASTGPATSAAASSGVDGLSGDFAALLSAQTLGQSISQSGELAASAAKTSKNPASPPDASDKSIGEPLDPSIIASMLGLPQLPPANLQQPYNVKFAQEGAPDNKASLEAISVEAKLLAPTDYAPPSSTDAETSAEANSFLAIEHPTPSSANEAANIAAAPATSGSSTSSFGIAMANAASSQNIPVAKQTAITTPLSSNAWPTQFNEKIVWLAKNDQQSAQININPPQLGPVQITLYLNGDQANAVFASPHAEVRHAIETAMPQLREMLSSAGISLGEANVGGNFSQQGQHPSSQSANRTQLPDENAILPANANISSSGSTQTIQRGSGLVDLFA